MQGLKRLKLQSILLLLGFVLVLDQLLFFACIHFRHVFPGVGVAAFFPYPVSAMFSMGTRIGVLGVSHKDTTFAVSGVSGPSAAGCQLGVDTSELGVSCCKILRRKAELLPGEIDGAGLVEVEVSFLALTGC